MANSFFKQIDIRKLNGDQPRGDHISGFIESSKKNLNGITNDFAQKRAKAV